MINFSVLTHKLQSRTKYSEQIKEIQGNLAGLKTFGIYICATFDWFCQSLIPWGETRHPAISLEACFFEHGFYVFKITLGENKITEHLVPV